MNSQSNAMPERLESPAAASTPAPIPLTQEIYWSVRRELWENRAVYVAPIAVAGVYLFGFFLSLAGYPAKVRKALTVDAAHQHHMLIAPYEYAAGLLMVTSMVVGVFYCLDALYGERRDRSVLFWKSLPVSDWVTVLSKASIPYVVLPVVTFVVTVALQGLMLTLSSVVLLGSGLSAGPLWREVDFERGSLMLLYHLVTVHVLSHAPFYAWLLLVSSWARRLPFLWAFLPPMVLGFLEMLVFNTTYFGSFLMHRLAGVEDSLTAPGTMPMDPLTHVFPGHFLSSAGLWVGLLLSAAFLAGAVRMRRYRDPI